MLFDDRILLIHTPKCAGMAATKFLIDNAPCQVTMTVPPGHARSDAKVSVVDGRRHETLQQASKALKRIGRDLQDFEMIISIMRNPYDLEVSYYHYKRLGHPWDAGKPQELAMAGDFVQFARHAPFYGRLPARIEDWYQIDGEMPSNLRFVRFESLEVELSHLIEKYYPITHPIQRVNATNHEGYKSYLSRDAEEAIYWKYRWLFDSGYYPRESIPDTAAAPG